MALLPIPTFYRKPLTAKHRTKKAGIKTRCALILGRWVFYRLCGISLSLSEYLQGKAEYLTVVQSHFTELLIPQDIALGDTQELQLYDGDTPDITPKLCTRCLCVLGDWVLVRLDGNSKSLVEYLSCNSKLKLIQRFMVMAGKNIPVGRRRISAEAVNNANNWLDEALEEAKQNSTHTSEVIKYFKTNSSKILRLMELDPEKYSKEFMAKKISEELGITITPRQFVCLLNKTNKSKKAGNNSQKKVVPESKIKEATEDKNTKLSLEDLT